MVMDICKSCGKEYDSEYWIECPDCFFDKNKDRLRNPPEIVIPRYGGTMTKRDYNNIIRVARDDFIEYQAMVLVKLNLRKGKEVNVNW